MVWSYDDSLPTARDKVRFRIGDIDTDRQLLQNETIDALLTEYNDGVLRTSVVAVRSILAQLARDIDRSVLGISGSIDQATEHFRALLAELVGEMNTAGGIYPGVLSVANERIMNDQNGRTYKAPDFEQGQFDMGGNCSIANSKDCC